VRPLRLIALAAVPVAAALVPAALRGSATDFLLPGSQPLTSASEFPSAVISHLFIPPDGPAPYLAACSDCHTTSAGLQGSPLGPWQGSMMSMAGRDPLFYAQLDLANTDDATRPEVSGAGDLCLRCHLPVGWLEGRSSDTTGLSFQAKDLWGVQCHACHRLVDPGLAVTMPAHIDVPNILTPLDPSPGVPPTYGNGMYVMDPRQTRRGPYGRAELSLAHTDVVEEPLAWSAVTTSLVHPAFKSAFHRSSNLCGTCHDVSNPVDCPGSDKTHTQQCFPIERTWSEWNNSAFPARGEAGNCQSCHMSGPLNDVAFGAACDGGFEHFGDLHYHDLTGGNAFAPRVIKEMVTRYDACVSLGPACSAAEANFKSAVEHLYPRKDPAAPPGPANYVFSDVNVGHLDAGIARVQRTLARAAFLTVPAVSATSVTARVTNRTGHKLPTGYPEGRRMWLAARFVGPTGTVIAQSGRYETATGALYHDQNVDGADGGLAYDRVGYTAGTGSTAFVAIPGRPTKVWEGRAKHGATGTDFHFVLNDTLVMDNRIPPEGWTVAGFTTNRALPVIPATYLTNAWQADYAAGVNHDDTAYPLPGGTDRVELTLNYQTASREYIEALENDNPGVLTDSGYNRGKLLREIWERPAVDRSAPVTMARRVVAVADADGDGLSDGWEAAFPTAAAANDDTDGDGRSNTQEFQEGTDPTVANAPVRPAVDIVLVLDVSGSMNDPAPGTSTPKIQVLKDAVTLFLETWKDYAVPGDRIGVVYFANDATQHGPAPLLKSFQGEWMAIRSEVQAATAGGWTAMGTGLHRAFQGLTDASRPRHLILFSNGMQNFSPMVVGDAPETLELRNQTPAENPDVHGASSDVLGAPVPMPSGVVIHTVGIGLTDTDGGTSWHQLLVNLANRQPEEGQHNFVTAAWQLEGVFLENLVGSLKGNTIGYVLDERRALGAKVETFPVPVNRGARKLSLEVTWEGGQAPQLELRRPDGQLEPLQAISRGGASYRIVTRYLDGYDRAPGDYGTWELRLTRGGRKPGADDVRGAAPDAQMVQVHALVDDVDVHYVFLFPRQHVRIGQPMRVQAFALGRGEKLKRFGRVTVTVTRPGASVGAELADSRRDLADPQLIDPDLRATPFMRRLVASFRDPSWAGRLRRVSETLDLVDDGTHGDGLAGDGILTRQLSPPTVPGNYGLAFRLEGVTLTGEKFVREARHTVLVEIGLIDLKRSRVRRIDVGGQPHLVLTPRDAAGNLLGPGYAGQITATAGGQRLVLQDNLDGSYRAPLPALFVDGNPVRIRIGGSVLVDGPVPRLGFWESIPWWTWLLLLLLILLVWWLWWRFGP